MFLWFWKNTKNWEGKLSTKNQELKTSECIYQYFCMEICIWFIDFTGADMYIVTKKVTFRAALWSFIMTLPGVHDFK